MSVDVEDWFQVQAFAAIVDPASWNTIASRVEASTDRILQAFDAADTRATFFTLGWVAERHPALIRRIVAAGHELASHGYGHALVHTLTQPQFHEDLTRAKTILEQTAGVPIIGYRAPTFSIGPKTPWAYQTLAETGHRYSSSIYPVRHDLYGAPDAPRFPHPIPGATITEIPMTTLPMAGRNLPISGGGYFRLMPYRLYRTLLRRYHTASHAPSVFYYHPWEVDPAQPRLPQAPRLSRFRHTVNLAAMAPRVDRLLQDFKWDRMDRVFADHIPA